jgi:hypothetical protein
MTNTGVDPVYILSESTACELVVPMMRRIAIVGAGWLNSSRIKRRSMAPLAQSAAIDVLGPNFSVDHRPLRGDPTDLDHRGARASLVRLPNGHGPGRPPEEHSTGAVHTPPAGAVPNSRMGSNRR